MYFGSYKLHCPFRFPECLAPPLDCLALLPLVSVPALKVVGKKGVEEKVRGGCPGCVFPMLHLWLCCFQFRRKSALSSMIFLICGVAARVQ